MSASHWIPYVARLHHLETVYREFSQHGRRELICGRGVSFSPGHWILCVAGCTTWGPCIENSHNMVEGYSTDARTRSENRIVSGQQRIKLKLLTVRVMC